MKRWVFLPRPSLPCGPERVHSACREFLQKETKSHLVPRILFLEHSSTWLNSHFTLSLLMLGNSRPIEVLAGDRFVEQDTQAPISKSAPATTYKAPCGQYFAQRNFSLLTQKTEEGGDLVMLSSLDAFNRRLGRCMAERLMPWWVYAASWF